MKKRLKKYIAQVLLLVFTMPLTFQSYHIMHHHAEYDMEKYGEYCCSTSKPDYRDDFVISNTETDCVICNYKFSTNDLPKASVFRSISLVIKSCLNELKKQIPFQQVFSDKSPRSPPTSHL
jgi:hypothetical protein